MFSAGNWPHYRVAAANQVGIGPFSIPVFSGGDPLFARYDTNRNERIDRNEVIAAINDYLFGAGEKHHQPSGCYQADKPLPVRVMRGVHRVVGSTSSRFRNCVYITDTPRIGETPNRTGRRVDVTDVIRTKSAWAARSRSGGRPMITTKERYRGLPDGVSGWRRRGNRRRVRAAGRLPAGDRHGGRRTLRAGAGPVDRRHRHGPMPGRQPDRLRGLRPWRPDGPLPALDGRGIPQQHRGTASTSG